MKTRLIFVITILVILINQVGCSTDSSSPSYENNRYFTVIDRQTEEPVAGAFLRVRYHKDLGALGIAPYTKGDYTDNDGSVCFTIPAGAEGDGYYLAHEQYKNICVEHIGWGFPSRYIPMDFECYIQFEIKNEEPRSYQDIIKIQYSGIRCGLSYEHLTLYGAEIDTTIICSANPQSPTRIDIESFGANPFNIFYSKHVISRDTTIVNILY